MTTSIQKKCSFGLRNDICMTFLPLFEEMVLGDFSHWICDNAGCLYIRKTSPKSYKFVFIL